MAYVSGFSIVLFYKLALVIAYFIIWHLEMPLKGLTKLVLFICVSWERNPLEMAANRKLRCALDALGVGRFLIAGPDFQLVHRAKKFIPDFHLVILHIIYR
jgi:hypothetical protein